MVKEPRILILEDLATDAELAIRELRRAELSFEFKRVDTKDAFLKALKEFKPDLILSDFSLPQLNALDALDLLKELYIETPFILYTGSLTEEVAVKCMKEGASDYILKSNLKRLPTAVLNALEKNTSRRAKEVAIAALRESEEKFRSLIETTNDRIWATDAEGRMTYNNPAVERILGYHPADLLDTDSLPFMHPKDCKTFEKMFSDVVTKKQGWTGIVFRWRHKDGSYRYLESNAVPILDANGEFAGFRGTDRDITKRKEIEEELVANEMRLAEAQRAAHLGSWEWNIVENKVTWSDELYRIFGLSPQEFNGTYEAYLSYVHPEDRQMVNQWVEQALCNEKFPDCENRIVRCDGEVRIINAAAAIKTDESGNPMIMTGIAQDITERRLADNTLRENEYKLRTLIESMNEGLLQVDNDDRIQFANEFLYEMVGYTEEELLGTDWTRLLPEEEHGLIKQVNERRRKGVSDRYEIRLRKKSGEILWVIIGGAPVINAEGVITGSMGTFTDITERKRAEEQLLHDAFHDGLTGLPNRTLFIDHLRLTIERGKRKLDAIFAVLFLDFDRFKIINDSLGHAEGDKLLQQIARRLESFLRPGDLVARLGGDEFTILLNELDDESDALRIAERIQEELKSAFNLGGREVFTSASIGIALSSAGHDKAEDMLRDADTAMYRAKAKGKAQYQVFDQEMHQQALAQLQLETEMRQALERGEFSLHYQPIIKLQTNDLAGFEALVRWNHPVRGMISPMEFIPLAEETGLILPLGKWILHESCRQLRKWQNHNSLASAISISVNLSCKQFLQFDLAEQVAATLKETGLAPNCLKLEITESYILENTETAVEMMNRLRRLGVEISLDDFGTGYSSLSYLHRLPIDYLKIDRSFINRMAEGRENCEIVYTIIKLARNLKMKVVAEGIETDEQLTQLKKLGCDYGQGYFFSKPLKAAAVALVNSAKSDFNPVQI